jgi:protein SCO1/2
MRRRSPLAPIALGTALVAALVAIAIVVLGNVGGSSPSRTAPTEAATDSGFDGAVLPPSPAAPLFTLSDQHGHRVSLGDLRGRVVVLTFLYSTCGSTCFVIAQQIRGALNELADEQVPAPTVLIVSASPATDTPANVRRFLAETSLTGRVRYLTGSLSALRPIWRAYRITPASAGRAAFDESASLLLIDAVGRERVLYQLEALTPESLAHDVRRLAARGRAARGLIP